MKPSGNLPTFTCEELCDTYVIDAPVSVPLPEVAFIIISSSTPPRFNVDHVQSIPEFCCRPTNFACEPLTS